MRSIAQQTHTLGYLRELQKYSGKRAAIENNIKIYTKIYRNAKYLYGGSNCVAAARSAAQKSAIGHPPECLEQQEVVSESYTTEMPATAGAIFPHLHQRCVLTENIVCIVG